MLCYDDKISDIKSSLKNGEMFINVKSTSDITLEKLHFIKAAQFFEEVFGIKVYLNRSI